MNYFNLNKVTNRIVVIVLVVISLAVIIITIILAFILTNMNFEKELKSLEKMNLDKYYKSDYVIKSIQNRLLIITKQIEFNYSRFNNNTINKDILLQNITTNLLLTAPNLELGYGIGYWFEPYVLDSNKYYGVYAIKKNDSAFITKEYNDPSYNYHNQYWYTHVIPSDWDRSLPLLSKFHWSDIYLDSSYSNIKMITLGIPIYNSERTIVGITTYDLTDKDFELVFEEDSSLKDIKLIFSKKFSKNYIYTNDSLFCSLNKKTIDKVLLLNQNSKIIEKQIKINGEKHHIFKSIIQDQFVLTLIIPSNYINNALFTQISIVIGFAILIIILIIFGFVYSYKVIIEHSLNNEHLKNYYKKLIENSPNDVIIFDDKGKLVDYNEAFNNSILLKNNLEIKDVENFLRKIIKYQDEFNFDDFEFSKLNNFKFYLEITKTHYLVNSFVIDIENRKSFVFVLININELVDRENEIKNLNKNLERLIANRTEQLEGAMTSLQDLNKKLSKNMNDLTRVNKELSISEQKLKSTIEAKEKFFSVLTHDIKNPLHSIKMIIELLRNYFNIMKEEEIKSFYNKISKTLDSINGLIDNVLLWSKSQSNLIEFDPELLDLSHLVNNSIKLLDSSLSQKNIIVRKYYPQELFVKTDKNMFEVIFRNILSNAIKFSKKDSIIEVIITEDEDKENLIISIQDYGVGMDNETFSNIFNSNKNNVKSGTDGEKGTGIGLLLCKNFIDLMNEKIWVESSLNQGTKFSFTINKLI